ncbi:MAG: carbohydrate ABC transporter permease [Oscillospiraceae bacterium]|nr:carbohydrate ABC transporter permease [Oscillospiraceae bacterium]
MSVNANTAAHRRNAIKSSLGDRVFDIVNHSLLIIFLVLIMYPLYFVLLASVSAPVYVNSGEFLLWPKGFQLMGYNRIFTDSRIGIGYLNTIIYVTCGTGIGLFTQLPAGYALSRKDLPGKNIIMALMVFTMYFGGGLIPLYMLVRNIGLQGSRLAIIILGCTSVYNIIIVRSFFSSTIPLELQDAAFIDGCSNQRFFVSIVLPLSLPVISVIALWLAVYHWNAYFNAMIFLSDKNKFPLQLFLREILITTNSIGSQSSITSDVVELERQRTMVEVMKYAIIVVSTAPIICFYPFLQKYFVRGVMIGSIKG